VGVCTLVPSKRAVFFDRDGVLNEAVIKNGKPYPPHDPKDLRLAPDASHALQRLTQSIPLLFVVTNQPDVARGTQTRANVEAINAAIMGNLPITRTFTCYHDDTDACECRKPKPGALLAAAKEFGIDLGASFMVGDRWRDIDAGASAGCTTLLLDQGYDEQPPANKPDVVVRSLAQAVDHILAITEQTTLSHRGNRS
jgi:D-glycero-D-manno-heptose 1,7-bisphosphate phosphatase